MLLISRPDDHWHGNYNNDQNNPQTRASLASAASSASHTSDHTCGLNWWLMTDLISLRSLSCLTLTITPRWFHPCLHRLPWSLGCGQADQGLHCWGESADDCWWLWSRSWSWWLEWSSLFLMIIIIMSIISVDAVAVVTASQWVNRHCGDAPL